MERYVQTVVKSRSHKRTKNVRTISVRQILKSLLPVQLTNTNFVLIDCANGVSVPELVAFVCNFYGSNWALTELNAAELKS